MSWNILSTFFPLSRYNKWRNGFSKYLACIIYISIAGGLDNRFRSVM